MTLTKRIADMEIKQLILKNVNISSEILNSLDEIKRNTSSIQVTFEKEMKTLVVSINSGTKSMLDDSQFHTLDAIMKKFEMVESRFASIRKYVKTLPTTTSQPPHQQKALQIESSGFPYTGMQILKSRFFFRIRSLSP